MSGEDRRDGAPEEALFERLAPPEGGLEGLRARLDTDPPSALLPRLQPPAGGLEGLRGRLADDVGVGEVFVELQPPPGGLAGLRARLAEVSAARRRRLRWGSLLAAAGLLAVVLSPPPEAPLALPDDPVLSALLDEAPASGSLVLRDTDQVATAVTSSVEGLAWYRIGSRLPPEPLPEEVDGTGP